MSVLVCQRVRACPFDRESVTILTVSSYFSYTMAPEVLKGSYTNQADMWSVGVIAYMLLSSQMPFYGRKRSHIVESIMKGKFDFKGRRWKRLSAQSKEFVKSLLVVDPEERLDADESLGCVWLNRRMTATVRNPYEEEIESAKNSLVRYAGYSKLKQVALMVVAHKSSTQEIGILRKVFQKYDTKKDGQLSYEEFKAAMHDAGFGDEDYQRMFDSVVGRNDFLCMAPGILATEWLIVLCDLQDLDGTGKIRYTEFLAATIEAQGGTFVQCRLLIWCRGLSNLSLLFCGSHLRGTPCRSL